MSTQSMNETPAGLDILWVFAHPDDESFGYAGSMLLAHEAGLRTGLVCATRGEAGEIRDPRLATRETLAAVREQELRRAMALARLGVLRLLPYRDSGMAGTVENEDPRALVQASRDEAVAHVVGQIRDLRPRAVVTFGPDGIYGHPDHIRIGEIADAAVIAAAADGHPGLGAPWRVGALYHAASSRERIMASATNPESPFSAMTPEELERMGVPEASITHWIDVSSMYEAKHAVVMQHLTQVSRESPVSRADSELARAMLSRETYARQELPWGGETDDPITALRDAFPARSRG